MIFKFSFNLLSTLSDEEFEEDKENIQVNFSQSTPIRNFVRNMSLPSSASTSFDQGSTIKQPIKIKLELPENDDFEGELNFTGNF